MGKTSQPPALHTALTRFRNFGYAFLNYFLNNKTCLIFVCIFILHSLLNYFALSFSTLNKTSTAHAQAVSNETLWKLEIQLVNHLCSKYKCFSEFRTIHNKIAFQSLRSLPFSYLIPGICIFHENRGITLNIYHRSSPKFKHTLQREGAASIINRIPANAPRTTCKTQDTTSLLPGNVKKSSRYRKGQKNDLASGKPHTIVYISY